MSGDDHPLGPWPTDEQVLRHGFRFRPAWWQPRVPCNWADHLHNLPEAEGGRDYHCIYRRDLLTAHRGGSPDDLGRLLVDCYVWGTGTSGWLAGRRARVFRDTDPAVLVQRLLNAHALLASDGPGAAYESLSDGGANRTKHMRASFFSKFLYAADAPGDGACGRALILDQFVAVALRHLDGWTLPRRGPWERDTYEGWLKHAHEIAANASRKCGTPVRPDAVETAYFTCGRRLAKGLRG